MEQIRKAILLVAGSGTRFLPATKAQPKEMLPVVDKPVIQYLVEEVVDSGIKEIIFVTGRGKRSIEDHFDYAFELEQRLSQSGKKELLQTIREVSNLAKFTYVRQKEPRGDGDALLSAAHLIGDEPFAVLFGDDLIYSKTPVIKQLINVFNKYRDPVIAIENIPKKDVKKYGIIKGTQVAKQIYEIQRVIEKPKISAAPSTLAVIGKYILTPEIIKELKKFNPSKSEVRIADALDAHLKTKSAYGYQFEGRRYDCGSKIGFLKATVEYGLRHPETAKDFKQFIKNVAKN